ncbi:MAG TPA: hypothetical protein VLE96_06915 [Chlamydiales bacterium]|nr:hypothetical protein [Chlamydiales bacterium]
MAIEFPDHLEITFISGVIAGGVTVVVPLLLIDCAINGIEHTTQKTVEKIKHAAQSIYNDLTFRNLLILSAMPILFVVTMPIGNLLATLIDNTIGAKFFSKASTCSAL